MLTALVKVVDYSFRLVHGIAGDGIRLAPLSVGETYMLWTIFVILLVLWLLGLATSFTLHGFIYVLLVAALVVLVIQLVSGRRVV